MVDVTVLTIAYRAGYIDTMVQALQAQTLDKSRWEWVLVDDRWANWKAFDNHYWPALYVIDRHGTIRELHVGELHQGSPAWDSLLSLIGRLRREAL